MNNKPHFPTKHSNINLLWASLMIEELVRHGVTDFCIAPGSRSTPLTLAVAGNEKATSHVHFDERGLGFLALGLAVSNKTPIVLITTSGSAVANLHPAMIEAKQSSVPLIVLSADRPPELIDCGANQAIDQSKIFNQSVCFFAQIPSPTHTIPASFLLTTLDQSLVKQKQQRTPIHFNCAFAEPLYPTEQMIDYLDYLSSMARWQENQNVYTQYKAPKNIIEEDISSIKTKKIMVVAGRFSAEVSSFCRQHHFPLLADIQSSQCSAENNLVYYDLALLESHFSQRLHEADVILQFGEKLISKRLDQFIQAFKGEYWVVAEGIDRIDPNHKVSERFTCDAKSWLANYELNDQENNLQCINWCECLFEQHKKLTEKSITPFLNNIDFSETAVINVLDELLPDKSPLFIGNSMPIRIADMFMHKNKSVVYTNRGASGIDGLLATSIGVAKHHKKAMTLLIGDTSFLYDLNSLALLAQLDEAFVIILINNDGGSIFNMLPVPLNQKARFYQLPHGLHFKPICEQFSVNYQQPTTVSAFKACYQKALKINQASLIEINVENGQTLEQLNTLKMAFKDE